MSRPKRLRPGIPIGVNNNKNIHLIGARFGDTMLPHYSPDSVEATYDMNERLLAAGGFPQQNRMIRDKRHSLDQATKYSYQAALIKKCLPHEEIEEKMPVRALINPNKLKQDYDDKIVSIGFEHGFHSGDVFKWCNTGSYWLIYLQDLEELAYFRGQIRRCSYIIDWLDEDGNIQSTYAAIRGPVETKINFIEAHHRSIDVPNLSLNILMPKNEETMHKFVRYSKFYLQDADSPDNKICWGVEATDSISTPGILEVVAVEYYGNETTDDIENGLVDAFVKVPEDPNPDNSEKILFITGETFIKPKKEYTYSMGCKIKGEWYCKDKVPVKIEPFEDENGFTCATVKWFSAYSGQFVLCFNNYEKTIVVESLF